MLDGMDKDFHGVGGALGGTMRKIDNYVQATGSPQMVHER